MKIARPGRRHTVANPQSELESTMAKTKKTVRVCLDLDPITVALLDVTAEHTGKSREEMVADALRCLFVAIPRPDDAP
jgi:hypothetical protein